MTIEYKFTVFEVSKADEMGKEISRQHNEDRFMMAGVDALGEGNVLITTVKQTPDTVEAYKAQIYALQQELAVLEAANGTESTDSTTEQPQQSGE